MGNKTRYKKTQAHDLPFKQWEEKAIGIDFVGLSSASKIMYLSFLENTIKSQDIFTIFEHAVSVFLRHSDTFKSTHYGKINTSVK